MALAFKPAPLSGAFMLISIAGFLFSTVYLWTVSKPWAFAFAIVFAIMFIAAMISMTYSPVGKVH